MRRCTGLAMLDGGADQRYLARRITAMAWDDIGLADPRALQIARDAVTTCERFGGVDGEIALSQAVIYLAVAAKSNAGGLAFMQARSFVAQDRPRPVPAELRHHALAGPDPYGEALLPVGMGDPGWYRPVPRGLEIDIARRMQAIRIKRD